MIEIEYGTDKLLNILNLGAGVQSSTVLLMSLDGELPPIDAAIFADTGWEPAAVYRQMDWLQEKAEAAGVRVYRVSSGDIRGDSMRYQANHHDDATRQLQRGTTEDGRARWGAMPMFTLSPEGKRGMIRRQCTAEYKIQPIERCIRREILGLKPRQHAPRHEVIRQWFGISHDELQRMKISQLKFIRNYYPLIEHRITRQQCLQWLKDHGHHAAPRSACIGCPFHSDHEWLEMKRDRPDEWADAVGFDRAIRNCGGMRGQVFLHRSCRPLEEVALRGEDDSQLVLAGFDDECSGICGV